MKIWVLVENTACREDLVAEHGLSLYIETGDHKILFDMGQSGAFWDNAAEMGVDLSQVDMAVLSHGHYDHGGGLSLFLQRNDRAPVYVSPHAFEAHYNGSDRYIGLDPKLATSDRLVWVEEELELGEGICLRSGNGWDRPYSTDPFGLKGADLQPDDFRHEQYLLVREGDRRICISGCSHKGILNIAQWFRPDVLVGGFHFKGVDPDAPMLVEAARILLKHPTVYYTGHCTGEAQYRRMEAVMGSKLRAFSTGAVIEV